MNMMIKMIVACLLVVLLLIGDADSFGLQRAKRDSIGRIDNSRQGFFVRDRGHRNCEGLWKRCMEISEGTSKRGSCVRGYNKLWCKDQACPGQGWCENESQLGSN